MSNVRPIRPGMVVSPAGASVTVEVANEISAARQSASNWRLAFFAMTALAGYQWYRHSGRGQIRRMLGRS